MADKDLNVNVNVGGKDNLSPALERQKKLVEDLAAAEANLAQLRKDYGAGGADLVLAGLRQELAALKEVTAERQKQTTILQRPPPGGGGGDGPGPVITPRPFARLELPPTAAAQPLGELSEGRQQAKAEVQIRRELADQLREAKDREIRERAYQAVTGKASPEAQRQQVLEARGQESEQRAAARAAEVAVRTAAGVGPTLAHQAVMLGRPTGENAMAGVGRAGALLSTIGGALPGPIGAAVSALGALGQVAGILGEEFRGARASLAEMTAQVREQQGLLRGVRQTGAPTAENLWQAFAGTDAMREMTRPGLSTAQRATALRASTAEAQGEAMELSGRDLSADRSRVEQYLFRYLREARGGGNVAYGREELGGVLSGMGVTAQNRPAELQQMFSTATARNMTEAQIREMARVMTTGRMERLLSRVEMGRSILQSGIMPDLRPGAAQLADLPALFKSQQKDFLDIHGSVQAELVRDQREEQRFQAQYQLWERILRRLDSLSFTPPSLAGWPDSPSW